MVKASKDDTSNNVIKKMLHPKDIVKKLRPCAYTFSEDNTNKINYGFIAQHIQEDFGGDYDFLFIEKDGTLKVKYFQFIGPLVQVVQMQQKQIKVLKKKLKLIEKKLDPKT